MAQISLKEIKKSALNIIKDNKQKEFFKEDIISLSQNNVFDKAKEKLEILSKNWESNYINFLEAFTMYIFYISKKGNLTYNQESKKDIQKFYKIVKKSIKKIESNFDDTYLLIATNEDLVEFSTYDNIQILNIIDELTQILNHFEYNKEADALFMIKGKIELGIQRYLHYKKEEVLLKKFMKSGEFEKCNEFEYLEIFNKFLIEKKEYKKLITKLSKTIDSEGSIQNILNYLIGLKSIEKVKYNSEIKKYTQYFTEFPENILTKKEFEEIIRIKSSINPILKIEFIKKTDKYLINLKSVKIANLIAQNI